MSLIFLLGTIVGVLAVIGALFISKKKFRKLLRERLELKLLSVRLPQGGSEEKNVLDEIAVSEQLFSVLTSFKKPFAFEVAVPHVGEEIHFYAAVPGALKDSFIRQVHALWEHADVRPAEEYNIFNYTGFSTGAWIKQKEAFALPIRTYREFNADTFQSLLGGLSKIGAVGEGGAIQYIVKPASEEKRKHVRAVQQQLRKGVPINKALEKRSVLSIGDVTEALEGKKESEKNNDTAERRELNQSAIQRLEAKASKPLFEVNIRVATSAPSQFKADALLDELTTGFSQFTHFDGNEFALVKPRTAKDLLYAFSFRLFDTAQTVVLNSEELASVFHFPVRSTAVPHIAYLKSREAAPPASMPAEGTAIGESVFRGDVREVNIGDDDRRRHMYIIGQTGTGKSTLLAQMAINDIKRGKGVGIIDPHGSTIDDILTRIPKNRWGDVILFDPSDLAYPFGLNMLEYDFNFPEQKTFIVNEMISIFDKLYDLRATGGPMFEQYMRNALQLLMEDAPNEPATLTELPRVFTDAAFRARKVARINNPLVIDFWTKEAAKAGGDAALANITPYITSKFNVFLTNDYVRPIIGQVTSSIHFRNVMDEGKILLVKLVKGRLGDISANLLGMIIIGKLLMAAFSRADSNEASRRDFNLFIDEFQNFTTDSVVGILSEARKYRLNLTIAHQFIAQLGEKIRDAVFGNVGSMVAFRVGAQDAEFLLKQFEPTCTASDLINIANFNAYARLLVSGETTKPFTMRTVRLGTEDGEARTVIRDNSQKTYGRDRRGVEAAIMERLRA